MMNQENGWRITEEIIFIYNECGYKHKKYPAKLVVKGKDRVCILIMDIDTYVHASNREQGMHIPSAEAKT